MSNDIFEWTDELAVEFCNLMQWPSVKFANKPIWQELDKFKQLKMHKKERIEVKYLAVAGSTIVLDANIEVPEGQYTILKEAIERVLNEEQYEDFVNPKILDQYQLATLKLQQCEMKSREAEEKAFNAARRVVHSGSSTERQLEGVLMSSLESMAAYKDASDYLNRK